MKKAMLVFLICFAGFNSARAKFFIVQQKNGGECQVVTEWPNDGSWLLVTTLGFDDRVQAQDQRRVFCTSQTFWLRGQPPSVSRPTG